MAAAAVNLATVAERLTTIFVDVEQAWLSRAIQQVATNSPNATEGAIVDELCDYLMSTNYPTAPAPAPRQDTGVVDLTRGTSNALLQIQASTHRPRTIAEVLETFPDAQRTWVEAFYDRLKNSGVELQHIPTHMVDEMLEKRNYPRKPKEAEVLSILKPDDSDGDDDEVQTVSSLTLDYYDTAPVVAALYIDHTRVRLMNDFPRAPLPVVREVMALSRNHYAPARKELQARFAAGNVKQLKNDRAKCVVPQPACPQFDKEAEFVAKSEGPQALNGVIDLDAPTKPEEQEIECPCCCDEYPFEELCQCQDGHLFCCKCVKKYIEESVFGQGSPVLHCLDYESGCKAEFAESQLRRALPGPAYKKMMAKLGELLVRKAGIEGLHQCPFCDYMAERTNPDDKVFKCQKCTKESCVLCNEENHIPLRCDEVEKKKDTENRTSVEEKMSAALLRQCHKCRARFLKEEGCNYIHCQCGAGSCYVCRAQIPEKMGYNHFCAHTRSPMPFGKCPTCLKCYLFFANTAQEDAKLVEMAEQKAKADQAAEPAEADGTQPPPAKRQKTKDGVDLPFEIPIVAAAPPPPAPLPQVVLPMLHRRGRKRRRYG